MSKETLTWFGIPIIMGIGFLLFQIAMDLPTEETTNILVGLIFLAVIVIGTNAVYKMLRAFWQDTSTSRPTSVNPKPESQSPTSKPAPVESQVSAIPTRANNPAIPASDVHTEVPASETTTTLKKPTPTSDKPTPEGPATKPAMESAPARVPPPSISAENAPEPTVTAQNQPSPSNAGVQARNTSTFATKLTVFAAGTLFGFVLFPLLQPLLAPLPTFNVNNPRQQQRNTAERLSFPGEDTETEPRDVASVAAKPPGPAVAPFDAEEAVAHQDAWAEHLGVEVEIENSIGMKLRLIPPGEFMMGSPESEGGRLEREGPQHRVRITRPFYLGVYPVTQSQAASVMGTNPSGFSEGGSMSDRVSGLSTDGFPVENVSWEDAQEFIGRLNEGSEERGRVYRLPTEAEWEYACRAGTTTRYYFGDDAGDLGEHGWYSGNTGGWSAGRTYPVGQKRPNAWGLYDMQGNVWEWCSDWLSEDYYVNSPLEDPKGPESGSFRVIRGSTWISTAGGCRSAYRSGSKPGGRLYTLGFRVARSVSSSTR